MGKGKVNKSQLIRDYLSAHPAEKANDVVAALAKQGHKVSANQVYFIKGKSAATKQRRARVVKAAKAASSGSANGRNPKSDASTLVREVKALAQRAGGYDKLQDLVEALAE